ncbi:MAG TPA: pyrroloquinoline quinone-dependent dehydrogenase [Terriglobia bacterium]|nr:pyrroloquinoline quinone-dependent dehydrogenase [Terriglobia bacterium]
MIPRIATALILILAMSYSSTGQKQKQPPSGSIDSATHPAGFEWRSYGGDPGGSRFSPLTQINRSNVARLKKVWTYHTGEVNPDVPNTDQHHIPSFEATPLMVEGVLYFSTPANRVIALDAETGREIWAYDPRPERSAAPRLMQNRGVAYWEGQATPGHEIDRRIFYGTFDGRLIALDARTGKPCPDFGQGGFVFLRAGVGDRWPRQEYSVTSPPAIYKDLVITGAQLQEYPSLGPGGAIRAFDVRTGKLIWQFNTVPGPGQAGHETWEGDAWKDRSGTNVWSIMSVDVTRGMVFLPLGSPSYDFYGADRRGQGLFGNSLVALDAASGKLIWYFQMVHHDLWDYDLPAPPTLVTVRRRGREIPAVAQVTKMGFVFVLDRLTGKPLFPVRERPVPPSHVPGESAWPTQPFPLRPPPLSRQSLARGEITRVTPESHKYCEQTFGSILPSRIFTPWGTRMTLDIPGTLGGATWSGASFDPASHFLFVNANDVAAVGLMKPQPEGAPERYRRSSPWGEYARFTDPDHYPCQPPPWGTLTAINLETGEFAWRVPLGVVDALEARGVPPTGAPNLGGTIATAGGLVFIGGSNDLRFRAFDARTGRVLWETMLEASGHATPMTYLGKKTGKQFVVIAAGGGGYFSAKVSDTLDAFALP